MEGKLMSAPKLMNGILARGPASAAGAGRKEKSIFVYESRSSFTSVEEIVCAHWPRKISAGPLNCVSKAGSAAAVEGDVVPVSRIALPVNVSWSVNCQSIL